MFILLSPREVWGDNDDSHDDGDIHNDGTNDRGDGYHGDSDGADDGMMIVMIVMMLCPDNEYDGALILIITDVLKTVHWR